MIISTYNRQTLVTDAIRSVLNQPFAELGCALELIVVDDGSTDATAKVVAGFGRPVRYVYQENAGPAAARNHALRLATGALLGFFDDDDLWAPGRLSIQLPQLLENPQVDVVLGRTQRMIRQDKQCPNSRFVDYSDPVRLYSLGCATFQRTAFERVSPLDEEMRHAEDDDWFMRTRATGLSMLFLPEVSLYCRFHEDNMSCDIEEKQPYMLRLVKKRLDRIGRGQKES